MLGKETNQLDPLYIIFEQHLCNLEDPGTDRKTFISNVVNDYFSYLRKRKITVPKELEQPIAEELFAQVHSMLVKKIYGCFSLAEYQARLPRRVKSRIRSQYLKWVA